MANYEIRFLGSVVIVLIVATVASAFFGIASQREYLMAKEREAAEAHVSFDCPKDGLVVMQEKLRPFNFCIQTSDCLALYAPTCDKSRLVVNKNQRDGVSLTPRA